MWPTQYESFNNKEMNNCYAVSFRWVSEPSALLTLPSSASSAHLYSSSRDSNMPAGICLHPWNGSEK